MDGPSPRRSHTDPDLFAGGPPLAAQRRAGLVEPGRLRVGRRVLLFVALTWLPLVVLTGFAGLLYIPQEGRGLLVDLGVWARYVVAGPLLLVGEAVAIVALSRLAERFAELLPEAGRPRLDATRTSVRRLRDLRAAEVVVALAAFALTLAAVRAIPHSDLPPWMRDGTTLSPAGWWHTLVSLPLLLMLVFGWLWRLVLWTRYLVLVSRLALQLVPVHPDKAAGIGFLGDSLLAFCPAGVAFGAIIAGGVANHVVHGRATLASYQFLVGGWLVLVLALGIVPLLVWAPTLLRVRRLGLRRYDELATALGRQFEAEWFESGAAPASKPMLERGDFSAATDLYQVVDRLHDLKLVPIDLRGVVLLAGATLLPFLPVLLLAMPLDEVVGMLLGLLH